jgi:hypothetical protein
LLRLVTVYEALKVQPALKYGTSSRRTLLILLAEK